MNLYEEDRTIADEVWKKAKKELTNRYHKSSKLEVCLNIINDFEITNPNRKYKSDLDVFIRESKLEDFFNENGETNFVSTIHKAKGKEFDNVFIMLENFKYHMDEKKRQLYVGMTRAKNNLTIHLNSNFFDNFRTDNLELVFSQKKHLQPKSLAMHLSMKDVWLDYFTNRQDLISQLTSGDVLTLRGNECFDKNGRSVLRFSRQFANQIDSKKANNYIQKIATVNFIVYWKNENFEKEIKVVLPELYFERDEKM